jgi:hypothetical protein
MSKYFEQRLSGILSENPQPQPQQFMYKNYRVTYDPPPIPDRSHDWSFVHDEYDGAPDAYDRRAGDASSAEAAIAEIDEIEAEWDDAINRHEEDEYRHHARYQLEPDQYPLDEGLGDLVRGASDKLKQRKQEKTAQKLKQLEVTEVNLVNKASTAQELEKIKDKLRTGRGKKAWKNKATNLKNMANTLAARRQKSRTSTTSGKMDPGAGMWAKGRETRENKEYNFSNMV